MTIALIQGILDHPPQGEERFRGVSTIPHRHDAVLRRQHHSNNQTSFPDTYSRYHGNRYGVESDSSMANESPDDSGESFFHSCSLLLFLCYNPIG